MIPQFLIWNKLVFIVTIVQLNLYEVHDLIQLFLGSFTNRLNILLVIKRSKYNWTLNPLNPKPKIYILSMIYIKVRSIQNCGIVLNCQGFGLIIV